MVFRFVAGVAGGDDETSEADCVTAYLAESEDEDAFSLLFMCDFAEPDAQEVSLGMDTHCLVTPDQGTAYGCVREVVVEGEVLRVVLDPASLADLELRDSVIEAVLRAPAADVARFREVLTRVLEFGRASARPAVRW